MSWSEEQTNAARVLFYAGKSATDAANDLSDQYKISMTRNAVIGKWTRMKLQKKDLGIPPGRRAKAAHSSIQRSTASSIAKRIERAAEQRATSEPVRIGEMDIRTDHACDLFGLTNESCRWPVGNPGDADFFFCGAPEADCSHGWPYCGRHTNIAQGA